VGISRKIAFTRSGLVEDLVDVDQRGLNGSFDEEDAAPQGKKARKQHSEGNAITRGNEFSAVSAWKTSGAAVRSDDCNKTHNCRRQIQRNATDGSSDVFS